MKNKLNLTVLFFICFLSCSTFIYGQVDGDIMGSSQVNKGDVKTYRALMLSTAGVYNWKWTVSKGGKITSQSKQSVVIEWLSTGTQIITYTGRTLGGNDDDDRLKKSSSTIGEQNFSLSLKVMVTSPISTPSTPSTPTIVNQTCTKATLKRGTPPSGITWYWQGKNATGTSTSNSNSTYTVISSGSYYLRARNSSGVWSSNSSSVLVILGTTGGTTWYADTDGDGLGDPNNSKVSCTKPTGYVNNNNDQCPTVYGGKKTWYADADGDGLGDPNSSKIQCAKPTGYVSNNNDQCPSINGSGSSNGCPSYESNNENYVYTVTPRAPVKTENALNNLDDENKQESITYYDGLGRPKQSIGIRAGGNKEDIITHIGYDEFGRQTKEYLPFSVTSNGGKIRTGNLEATTNQFYQNKYPDDFAGVSLPNVNAYSQKVFDNSPLNRVMEQAAPGKDWKVGNGHTIKFDYQTNAEKEVLNFGVDFLNNNTASPKLALATSYYPSSELYKTITKDENWRTYDKKDRTTEEFKNKQGQVILKRTYNNQQAHDTYYVYDDYGNLTYVLYHLNFEFEILFCIFTNAKKNRNNYKRRFSYITKALSV